MKGLIMKKEEERNIYAVFDDKTIRVYQAYNNEIADEALKLGKFGSKFSLNRMTWIKPSFLWMMYRSGWATKQGQERILAIDLKREGFDEIKDSIEEIITGNWHGDHENIAEAFEDIASPKTIEWVYYLALAHQFEGYEGGLAMARKCIHALGKINTPKSKEKLELLANNLNETEELRESAKRELNRHDFTNKDVE